MSLGVGIHKNVVLSKAEKNDKGTLVITIKEGGVADPLAVLSGKAGNGFNKQDVSIQLWPLTVAYGTEKKEVSVIMNDINDFRVQLEQILKLYITSDLIAWNPTFGTGITTAENLAARITVQDTLNKVYNNLVDQFIDQVKSFTGDSGKKFNIKLVRQKNKPFPTLPKVKAEFANSYPFVEDASVPVSKLAYSKYEIEKGLHQAGVATATQGASKEEATATDALFAKQN